MKFLGWVQSKINGKQEKKFNRFAHSSLRTNSCKEEFEDWPQTLLAIGTFGNNEVQNEEEIASESLQGNKDLCIEEVMKLQGEISKLLNKNPSFGSEEHEIETEEIPFSKICNGDEYRSKDLISDKHNAIRQKSISFLLKKMFVLGNGCVLHPNLRDSIPESLTEKILRKIIHKKIHPQTAPRATTSMKCLERNHEEEKGEDVGKWVKTDSEYIVLEI